MKNMLKKIASKKYKETIFSTTLPNGLRVYLMPKAGFAKTYGLFVTNYGSLDNEFIPLDGQEFKKVPAGIAHFLEHKVFELEGDKDASNLFAQLGADANAYTSFTETAYLFSTTSNVLEATKLLLDFVQNPHFTEESVEAEVGIIEQELKMYMDQPGSALMQGGLQMMYKENTIRNDIGGTLQSIKEITYQDLLTCYQTFYHPGNMIFVLVGNFDVDAALKTISENQAGKTFPPFKPIKRRYYLENNQVYQPFGEKQMAVIIPRTSVNLKIGYENLNALEIIKRDFLLQLVGDIYFSRGSDFYQQLKKDGIINNSFSFTSAVHELFGFLTLSCDTLQYEEFNKRIKEKLLQIRTTQIPKEDFERMKKVQLARMIRQMNSLEFWANIIHEAGFKDLSPFAIIQALEELQYEDLHLIQGFFVEKAIAVYQIMPQGDLT
jgi:predicted Zn-dependent peptidase